MRIIYVGQHGSGGNQDEDAVAYALTQLGHQVTCVLDSQARAAELNQIPTDFMLFSKGPDTQFIREYTAAPIVLWYWDMVEAADFTIADRGVKRTAWMAEIMPYISLGFCTDGDWVSRFPDKFSWLMQGADERYMGYGTPNRQWPPILFAGTLRHGLKRQAHIQSLQRMWNSKMAILGWQGPRYRKHGRELADIFASTKIVIAPDGPQTDNYWSNRVYLTMGLGGFILHPYCARLAQQYVEGKELVMYHSQDQLNDLIHEYLADDAKREAIRLAGFNRTQAEHTYRHRCAELVRIVQERVL